MGPARLVALLAFLLGLAAGAWAEVPVPTLQARVTDLTGTLSATERRDLEGDLQGLEERSGSQLAVLLVPTTRPEAIEQFSLRVVEAWKLGRQGKDNGVLLLVAKNDRRVRIEVGYGLEGAIPDAVARRVIDEAIVPRFKESELAGGIKAGVERLAALIEGRKVADGPADGASAAGVEEGEKLIDGALNEQTWGERLLRDISEVPVWLIVAIVIVGTGVRWLLGPFFGGLAMGGAVGAGAWFVTGVVEIALAAAVIAFIFVLVGLANWIGMALSGASSGGGSFSSGGGFSGGGGDFGGGGASGSW